MDSKLVNSRIALGQIFSAKDIEELRKTSGAISKEDLM
jgi:hypothetical protein